MERRFCSIQRHFSLDATLCHTLGDHRLGKNQYTFTVETNESICPVSQLLIFQESCQQQLVLLLDSQEDN